MGSCAGRIFIVWRPAQARRPAPATGGTTTMSEYDRRDPDIVTDRTAG
jgi:hypothetical protein